MNVSRPEVREIDAREVVYVSFVGNYLGDARVFEKLFDTLCRWADEKDLILPETLFLSAYYDDPEELRIDVCMTIPPEMEILLQGEVQRQRLPGGRYTMMEAELAGPEEYTPAWLAITGWAIENNNYEIDMSRPAYEIYLNSPAEYPEKIHRVMICLAVK